MKIIDNKEYSDCVIIVCDCNAELIRFFIDESSMTNKPLVGFDYFNSFIKPCKLNHTYFEFSDIESVKDFLKFVRNYDDTECKITFICNYYCIVTQWVDDSSVLLFEVHKVNKKGIIKNKYEFQIAIEKNKALSLNNYISKWVDIYSDANNQ